jgi:hypothetical protein
MCDDMLWCHVLQANAVGLYKAPVLIAHELISFLVTQSLAGSLTSKKPPVTSYASYPMHGGMLATLLAMCYTPQGFEKPGRLHGW